MQEENKGLANFYPMGDQALVIQFEHVVAIPVSERVQLLAKIIEMEDITGVTHLIPSFNNLTVCYDPVILSYQNILKKIQKLLGEIKIDGKVVSKTIHLPVVFGGKYGPDLPEISKRVQMTEAEIVTSLQEKAYYVFAIGFIAGYPYCGEIDERLQLPRRKDPRALVPKGTVQIVSNLTGIFTTDAPSGWHMVGWTPVDLFNPYKDKPSIIQAGDYVKYVAVEEAYIENWNDAKQSEWDKKWNM